LRGPANRKHGTSDKPVVIAMIFLCGEAMEGTDETIAARRSITVASPWVSLCQCKPGQDMRFDM